MITKNQVVATYTFNFVKPLNEESFDLFDKIFESGLKNYGVAFGCKLFSSDPDMVSKLDITVSVDCDILCRGDDFLYKEVLKAFEEIGIISLGDLHRTEVYFRPITLKERKNDLKVWAKSGFKKKPIKV